MPIIRGGLFLIRGFALATVIVAVALAAVFYQNGVQHEDDSVQLHQAEFYSYAAQIDSLSMSEVFVNFLSVTSRGIRRFFESAAILPSFDDPAGIVAHVFADMPMLALVYPSEGYYYFKTATQEGEIGGNFRVNDTEDGFLGFGYYLTKDQERRRAGYLVHGEHAQNPVAVVQHTPDLAEVRYGERRVLFRRPSFSLSAPESFPLGERERYVSTVQDESGLIFHLLFEERRNYFFFVLDPGYEHLLEPKPGASKLFEEKRSRFVFLGDGEYERFLLIGVTRKNVSSNSYFDGPFDQIPVKVPLRDLVYRAYPYLKLGGIDPYGFFCMKEGSRVAITPYMKYVAYSEIFEKITACRGAARDENEFRQCVTFDKKQRYHLDSKVFDPDGALRRGEPTICEYQGPRSRRNEGGRAVVSVDVDEESPTEGESK